MARKKKITLFKTQKQAAKYMSSALSKLGGSVVGGAGYRFTKNKMIADQEDPDKKSRMETIVSIGAAAAGAAGTIYSWHPFIEGMSIGAFSVASLDIISKSFGASIEQNFGVSLGEVPQNQNTPHYVIVDEPEDVIPEALPEPGTNDIDPLAEEIDKLLSELDNETQPADLSGTETVPEDIFEKLN